MLLKLVHYPISRVASVVPNRNYLVTIGMLFKVAAVPFHFWAPDVYEGSSFNNGINEYFG
jgi:NADH:ubiquinone oxidoreductase subunit 4 (subunit M)